MADRSFVTVPHGDVELNVAVQGAGPLILCIHGWPELWYSWRHQMDHFAAQGYTVAAMDVRGYGGSSKPNPVSDYTLSELCADAAAVIEHLSDGPAIVLGHDWGAPIAWNTARFHADKVRAVAGLSVPYVPVGPQSSLELWKAMYGDADKFFYQLYFLNEGVAEAEFEADNARALRMIYYSASGEAAKSEHAGLISEKSASATMLEGLVDPDPFPAWSTPEDLQVYTDAFDNGGWRGPLNRYRAQTLDAEQLGSLPDGELTQPAAFIGGELDPVRRFVPGFDVYENAGSSCLDFRGTTLIPDAGHWVQQEAPEATNAALDAFIATL